MQRYFLVVLACIMLISACDQGVKEVKVDADVYHQAVEKLSEISVHDIFSPPVASRIYAYPSIAAYELLASQEPKYLSLVGQVSELSSLPEAKEEVSYELAALEAFMVTGRALIFSEDQMDAFREELYKELRQGVNRKYFDASLAYGQQVSEHILAWADS